MVSIGDKVLLFRNRNMMWLEESGSPSVGNKGFLVRTKDANYFLRETSISTGNRGRLFNINNQYYLRGIKLGNIYVAGYYHLYKLYEDGSLNWSYEAPSGGYAGNAIEEGSNNNIWFGTVGGIAAQNWIYVLSQEGILNWSYYTGSQFGSGYGRSGLKLDSNNNVYIGCRNALFLSIDSGGILNWSYEGAGNVGSGIALSISENAVYCGDAAGYLYSLSTSDGSLNWSYKSSGEIRSEMKVDEDGNIYFCSGYAYGGETPVLNSVDLNGNLNWSFQIEDTYQGGIALSNDEDTIYTGDGDAFLHAIDENSGLQNWSYYRSGALSIDSSIAVDSNDNIYYGYESGFMSLNSNGNKRWDTYDIYVAGGCAGGVALSEGHVFFTSYSYLWDVLTENGTRSWEYPLGGSTYGAGVEIF